jgi:hypothetical protein
MTTNAIERPKRNSKKKRNSLIENQVDSNSFEEEFVVQEDDQSEEEFEKPKRRKQCKQTNSSASRPYPKQTSLSSPGKESILDLDEFYGNANDNEIIQSNHLPLPPHLNNLIFYPYTPLTFDFQNPSNCSKLDANNNEIKVDKNWLLIYCDRVSTGRSKLDLELRVRKCLVYATVPHLIELEGRFLFNVKVNRRGEFQSLQKESLSFTFDFQKKNLKQVKFH